MPVYTCGNGERTLLHPTTSYTRRASCGYGVEGHGDEALATVQRVARYTRHVMHMHMCMCMYMCMCMWRRTTVGDLGSRRFSGQIRRLRPLFRGTNVLPTYCTYGYFRTIGMY